MVQPDCGCFAHVDMSEFAGARCVHGEHGDQSDQTLVVVVAPPIFLTADSEA